MKKFEVHSDKIYDTLACASKLVGRLDVDGKNLKPCVARMIEEGLEKDGVPDRATGSVIIASQLRTLGKDEDYVLGFLKEWNQKNRPPRKVSEIESAVRSAFRKDYGYTCKSVYLEALCIGKEFCSFAKLNSLSGKYFNNRKFLEYGWQTILSNSAKDLYYIGIVELERRLGVGAGGIVIANHKRMAFLAGITPKTIGKALLELSKTPLIKHFKMGKPQKWEGKATEIQRTIPIPPPSKELLLKRKNYFK
jgi:hypothetical protein